MKYTECGVEIQYRECQILRETAKEILEDADGGSLVQLKEKWIGRIAKEAHANETKRAYAVPMTVFLGNLSGELFQAVAEYAEHLVRKGRGIDVMVPYRTKNRHIILPVNKHSYTHEDYAED